jgi:very-short-patch-repair endonuclease
VKHVYVPDGIYMSQSNPIEAQQVVKEIMEMIEQKPDLTYGIVTLNAKQKIVIEDEIESVRKDNPVFDSYISDSEQADEGFFVKNLESVQGDERDVIFISTTFGLDEKGIFRQHFGPINGKDGWRRLNVLFTRAKQHVRIFSSFQPERIKIDDTKEQRGLSALKDYLNYAITGIDNHSYLTGQEPDSDFERAVGSFLVSNGYDVVYQLGVAGYRIDMVVQHPQCPTDYVLAIECDGATYHSARSARDRDRLREENLRKLGWSHIHRIWSTDWFRRRYQEEARLLQAVELAVKAKVAVT